MGAQAPPHMFCFLLAVVTVVFAIIVLALDGYLNANSGFCFTVNYVCAATGLGITAGVFGLVIGGVAIAWLLLSELWDVGIVRFVVVIGMFLVAVLAFISGVLNAVSASNMSNSGVFGGIMFYDLYGTRHAAAAAFSFFLMVTAALTGVFGWKAGGGGTSAA